VRTWIAALGFGVLTTTVCGAESRFVSVTATVKPDGAETVGGDSAPPGPILNVAGMRAPLGAGGELCAEPGAGFGVVVVVVLVEAVVVVVLVEAAVVACEAGRVVVEEVLPAPPHPARSSTESSPRTFLGQPTAAA
jgi:hypothetical protein